MVCFMLFFGMYVDSYEAILTSFNRYGLSSLG